MTLSIRIICHYAECYHAEWDILFIIMLNVIVVIVIKLSVVAPKAGASSRVILLSDVMLEVIAPDV